MAMGQSADMEHHGGLARLYHLNETLRVSTPSCLLPEENDENLNYIANS
jgi:hypothetical protein